MSNLQPDDPTVVDRDDVHDVVARRLGRTRQIARAARIVEPEIHFVTA